MTYSPELAAKLYLQDEQSIPQIAESLGVYPNKVRRGLVRMGIPLKTKSEAQKIALASGRAKHPTEGTLRSDETKEKISEGTAAYWDKIDEFTRSQQCRHLADYRESLTEQEKLELQHLSSVGRRYAAKHGSKFEKYLYESLTSMGYNAIVHKKGAIINPSFEVDMLIPSIKTAIEVDGPTHYFPIHGDEKLHKQQRADAEKNGLLITEGWVVVRFKHITNNLTQKYKRDAVKEIVSLLKRIEANFPPEDKRLIYI